MKTILDTICFLMLCLVVCGCSERPGDGREGGSDKREWSILQGHEFNSRTTPIKKIEFLKSNDYNVICVPSQKDGRRIWIMMDAKSPPFYKQMPDGMYSLTKEELSEIEKRTNPTSTVVEALRSHIREE